MGKDGVGSVSDLLAAVAQELKSAYEARVALDREIDAMRKRINDLCREAEKARAKERDAQDKLMSMALGEDTANGAEVAV